MSRTLRQLYDLLPQTHRRLLPAMLTLLTFTAVVELIGIGSVLPFLSVAMDPGTIHSNDQLSWLYEHLHFTSDRTFLIFLGGLMLGFIVLTNLMSAISIWAQMRFVYSFGDALSVRLLTSYLNEPFGHHVSRNSSSIVKGVVEDASKTASLVLRPALTLVAKGIILLAIITLLVVLHPVVAALTILLLGTTYMAVYLKNRRRLEWLGRQAYAANQDRYKVATEAFTAIKTVKAFRAEKAFIQTFQESSAKFARFQGTSQIRTELPRYVLHAIAFGGFLGVFLVLLASGASVTDIVPMMGLFALAGLRALPSMQATMNSLAHFRYNHQIITKIHEQLIRLDPPRRYDPTPISFENAIKLCDVSFSYPGTARPAVRDVTLTIRKNAAVAFVGPTGAGKTTLADLLLGLYLPEHGQLLVDGQPITRDNLPAWQSQIGYVPQEIILLDDTIAKNIAFGVPDREIDMATIERAARAAQIHEFITNRLPEGYSTQVGERGARLSGGQRKRIGIARALYRDPQILILDEATSEVDGATESAITAALHNLAGSRTVIVIAHRMATVRECDMIFVVSHGSLEETGAFGDLMDRSPLFRKLNETEALVTP